MTLPDRHAAESSSPEGTGFASPGTPQTCTKCGEERSADDFYVHTSGRRYRHCKPCHRAMTRDRAKARQRAYARLAKLHVADFRRLLGDEQAALSGEAS